MTWLTKITKAFWEKQTGLGKKAHPAMKLFENGRRPTPSRPKLHPGALKYYQEIGFKVADEMK